RAHPCGLFGPRHRSSSRPASSRATAACTLLCASTPIVIMGRPFLCLSVLVPAPAPLPGGQGSLGSPGTRLLSGHAGGAARGDDRSWSGHQATDCVGQFTARRSILIVTESRLRSGCRGKQSLLLLHQRLTEEVLWS